VQIRCDNGPEYISNALKDWAEQQGIILSYIEPGNPQQNGKHPTIPSFPHLKNAR